MRKAVLGYELDEFTDRYGVVHLRALRPSEQHEIEDELLAIHSKFAANLR